MLGGDGNRQHQCNAWEEQDFGVEDLKLSPHSGKLLNLSQPQFPHLENRDDHNMGLF